MELGRFATRQPSLVELTTAGDVPTTPDAIADAVDAMRDMLPTSFTGPRVRLAAASACIRHLSARIAELEAERATTAD